VGEFRLEFFGELGRAGIGAPRAYDAGMRLLQRLDPRWDAQHRRSRLRAERAAAAALGPGESVAAHIYLQLRRGAAFVVVKHPHGAFLVLTDRRLLLFHVSPVRKKTALLAEAPLSDVLITDVMLGRILDTVTVQWQGVTGLISSHRMFRADVATIRARLTV
jgi:hypothetical protein